MEYSNCCERYTVGSCRVQTTMDFFREVCQKEGSYCLWMDFYAKEAIMDNALKTLSQPRSKVIFEGLRSFSPREFLSQFKPNLENFLKDFKLKQLQRIPITYFLHHN